jgi:hypothetical protein
MRSPKCISCVLKARGLILSENVYHLMGVLFVAWDVLARKLVKILI